MCYSSKCRLAEINREISILALLSKRAPGESSETRDRIRVINNLFGGP